MTPSHWLTTSQANTPIRQAALQHFLATHGDHPVRIFRCPGRINLRGMHVDTHGGYLNLMPHQREVVLVCAPRTDGVCRFINTDPIHAPFEFDLSTASTQSSASTWQAYATGAVLSAITSAGPGRFTGFDVCIASDIPEGAALSSSSALCLAVYLAACGCAGHAPTEAEQILACRDAEWYAGARTGTSDPAAMVLGRAGQLVNVSLLAEKFSLDTVRRIDFPFEDLAILVADSRTKRSLSGAGLIAYTRNRFAYSVALDVLRQEMANLGYREEQIAWCDRLAHIHPELFGGIRFLAALLLRVPESLSIEGLRTRYELPQLDELQQRYFASVPEEEWPNDIPLRGPLVYGLAESTRAERFIEHIESGAYEEAGRLMFVGHEGDRVVSSSGTPHDRTVQSLTLAQLADKNINLEHIPGDYGASAPVLDALVDAARDAGALGASLTGAGIAGSVLALCLRHEADAVREAWERMLPPGSVVENMPGAPAGELDVAKLS